ncbi:hydroxyquinol 1,2-dioxygenase [Streptomyces sp. NBC_01476]|uniref:dioxygenase family protein n=1 Tax=Streptomyces sp. NBC_01476 TaxID=2903881 RepID=UPI002E32FD1F|nr:dioxygenase [Streptomyces sp. NBC_01476]
MTGPESGAERTAGPARRAALEQAVTDEVVASFAHARTERFTELMSSLVRHLHAFARDVRLTQPEWEAAIAFLTATGQTCTDKRQEFILLSDVLGLSMQTVGINAASSQAATESTVFGPFFVEGSPRIELGGDIAEGVSGRPCYVSGRVLDDTGAPISGARVELWEADDEGFYDVQYGGDRMQARGHLFSGDGGAYRFWSVLPAPYPIPYDGPVGQLLDAANRSPMRPAHIHFMVKAPGCRTLITHIFVAGSPHLTDDAVFAVKPSLVVDFVEHPPGTAPDGRVLDGPWHEASFDLVLARTR